MFNCYPNNNLLFNMNKIEELKKIKQMLDDGILSESEYTLLKSEIINNVPANNLSISENVEIENDNQSSIDVEDIDTEEGELPIVKPHFGKKGVVLFFSIIAILVVIYQLNDKGLISFKNKTEISDDNIKDLADLETYINNEADSYCESWHKAIAYNNEQKKHEEWVRLDGRILDFEIQIIPLLVKNNDLPDEYVKKGADFFNKRLSSCGYYYYGGSPPDTNLNESNKIDESQTIEPVIINHENDSNETQTNDSEYDSTDSNENSSLNDKSNSNKPKYIIYDLGQSFNYDEAESECIKRKMRLPDYDELLEISNSPELMGNLKANDKSLSYWSSTDYIEGQPFSNMESVHGDNVKKYKKNYNPFTDKTIMTDTDIRMKKNCLCIEN